MPYYVDTPTRTETPTRIATPTKITNPTRMKLSNLYTAGTTTQVQVNNTTTETTIATLTIPQQNLSVLSQLTILGYYNIKDTTVFNSMTFNIYINGTLVCRDSASGVAAERAKHATGEIGIFESLGASGSLLTDKSLTSGLSAQLTNITIDTTSDISLVVKAQWASADAGSTFTSRGWTATLIG